MGGSFGNMLVWILYISIALVIALLVVIAYRFVKKMIAKKNADGFVEKYKRIQQGLSKAQVIDILGNNCIKNNNNGDDVFIWKCNATNSSVIVRFSNDIVTSYEYKE